MAALVSRPCAEGIDAASTGSRARQPWPGSLRVPHTRGHLARGGFRNLGRFAVRLPVVSHRRAVFQPLVGAKELSAKT